MAEKKNPRRKSAAAALAERGATFKYDRPNGSSSVRVPASALRSKPPGRS